MVPHSDRNDDASRVHGGVPNDPTRLQAVGRLRCPPNRGVMLPCRLTSTEVRKLPNSWAWRRVQSCGRIILLSRLRRAKSQLIDSMSRVPCNFTEAKVVDRCRMGGIMSFVISTVIVLLLQVVGVAAVMVFARQKLRSLRIDLSRLERRIVRIEQRREHELLVSLNAQSSDASTRPSSAPSVSPAGSISAEVHQFKRSPLDPQK